MLLIKLNEQYYLLSDDELSIGDYVITGQHELHGDLGIEIIGDEYSRLLSKDIAKKIIATTDYIGGIPYLTSSFMFDTLGGSIGVRFPDEYDSVMGYYTDEYSAFNALINWFSEVNIFDSLNVLAEAYADTKADKTQYKSAWEQFYDCYSTAFREAMKLNSNTTTKSRAQTEWEVDIAWIVSHVGGVDPVLENPSIVITKHRVPAIIDGHILITKFV